MEELSQTRASVAQHRWQDVLVVARHGRGAVAEDRLHDAVGHTCRQQERSRRVTQRMWRGISDTGPPGDAREVVADRAAHQWRAQRIREDEIMVLPQRAGMESQLGDVAPLGLQRCQGLWDQWDVAAAVLRLRVTSHTSLALELEHLLPHLYGRCGASKLYVSPA